MTRVTLIVASIVVCGAVAVTAGPAAAKTIHLPWTACGGSVFNGVSPLSDACTPRIPVSETIYSASPPWVPQQIQAWRFYARKGTPFSFRGEYAPDPHRLALLYVILEKVPRFEGTDSPFSVQTDLCSARSKGTVRSQCGSFFGVQGVSFAGNLEQAAFDFTWFNGQEPRPSQTQVPVGGFVSGRVPLNGEYEVLVQGVPEYDRTLSNCRSLCRIPSIAYRLDLKIGGRS